MVRAGPRSTSELLVEVVDDLRMLVRKEFELARIELIEGVKAQLIGAGVIVLAVVSLLPAVMFAIFALVFWLPFSPEVSFALVALVMLVVASVAIGAGIGIMKRRRPKLEKSVASIKEDVRWAREQLTS